MYVCMHVCFRYGKVRTELEEIFGPKMHQDFFKKFLPEGSCGNGFYVTKGNGSYPPGVALVGDTDGDKKKVYKRTISVITTFEICEYFNRILKITTEITRICPKFQYNSLMHCQAKTCTFTVLCMSMRMIMKNDFNDGGDHTGNGHDDDEDDEDDDDDDYDDDGGDGGGDCCCGCSSGGDDDVDDDNGMMAVAVAVVMTMTLTTLATTTMATMALVMNMAICVCRLWRPTVAFCGRTHRTK